MRSTLALLLLFGTGIGVTATHTCVKYVLPTAEQESCELTIDYQARDDKQALATCLEYFPTTFVKGVKTPEGTTKCTVTAAYQCVDADAFLIFDKCYKFPKDNLNEYVKGTITEYKDKTTTDLCQGGKLSVFYSHTHAKFVGMEAHRRNIDRLWIGITKDGKEIETPNRMIHSKMWKLVDNDYWDGDELKTFRENVPDEAKYYFMRTRTDYVYNRIQGHFERASDTVKATFACEFESAYTANQAWYCDKLPILGIDATYDDKKKPHRCLYVSANSYKFKGDNLATAIEAMKNVKGCQERPSSLHSAGMDDGTADPRFYAQFVENGKTKGLKYEGKMRIAAHVIPVDLTMIDQQHRGNFNLPKCGTHASTTIDNLRHMWKYLTHNGKQEFPSASQIDWDNNHPKNECSDFDGTSTSVGIKKGKKFDMPPEVRAPAVCSLLFFQECENSPTPLCGFMLECKNKDSFQKDTGSMIKKSGFFRCECPGVDLPSKTPKNDVKQPYKEIDDGNGGKMCKWTGGDDTCVWLHFLNVYAGQDPDRYQSTAEGQINLWEGSHASQEDRLDRVIVRYGCKVKIWCHRPGSWRGNFVLTDVGYGDHHVPNAQDKSLTGQQELLGASIIEACDCH